jgi:hypothetical protein
MADRRKGMGTCHGAGAGHSFQETVGKMSDQWTENLDNQRISECSSFQAFSQTKVAKLASPSVSVNLSEIFYDI